MTAPPARTPLARLYAAVGGRREFKLIALLSGSLALAGADQTIAGAVAPDLKVELGVSNTWIGLLVTAGSLMAAATTLPFGVLADRTHRVRLLAGCALEWSAAVTLAGFADTYSTVLIAQIALGAGVGAAGPLVASLVGDLFPSGQRGKALGFIVAGEFAGAASGLLIAGEIAAVWSWRGSFFGLAVFGPVLTIALLRFLKEPARGAQRTQDTVPAGNDVMADADIHDDTARVAPDAANPAGGSVDGSAWGSVDGSAGAPIHGAHADDGAHADEAHADLAAAVRATGVEPRPRLILENDPSKQSLAWAIRYVLSVPTNVVIIISSALAYFYVAGVQTFAIVYFRGKFDLSQSVATALLVVVGIGVIAGILATGSLSDKLIRRGHLSARLTVGGICFFVAVVAFVPGFGVGAMVVALPLLFLGAAGLGGVNPPLDAARLDVVHSRLWGRAEAIRTFCQNLIKSGAPLLFGYLSTVLADSGESTDAAQGGGAEGLNRAFMILTVLFVLAGAVLLFARRSYLRDTATAAESERRTG